MYYQKSLGSNNPLSVVGATMKGLLELSPTEQISQIRGETVTGPSFTAQINTRTFATGA